LDDGVVKVLELAEPAKMLLEAGIGWAVGRCADAGVKFAFTNRAARAELVAIGAEGVAAALEIAPELSADLGSRAYAMNVLAPAITEVLERRLGAFDAEVLSADFLARFVEPYLRERPLDDVLVQLFRLEPERLTRAFVTMAATLRSGFLRSEHWSGPVQGAALEELLARVSDVQARLPDPLPPPDPAASVAARNEARLGSEVLRNWPQTIARLHIERPELQALLRQVHDEPGEITLLIGVAGSGKSALLAELTGTLESDGFTVFPIKADHLPAEVETFAQLSEALGLARPLDEELEDLARSGPLVIIIDQLDAVSEVMDHTGRRMQVLLRLAHRFAGGARQAAAHVIVSSRPFEARHDGRFESLDAKPFELSLPTYERVERLLADLGIEPGLVPQNLQPALRRPFLLKLFVQIVQRGVPPGGLVAGELLNAWLSSAPLGSPVERESVLTLLKRLARDMAATETLWRPADTFDAEMAKAVQLAEACELVVRSGSRLSFAHQAWLDDFEARALGTSEALLRHAWSTQDGLFGRATVLRSLERFRASDEAAYDEALDGLLGDDRTRRHLKHLVVDLMASQPTPLPRELAWLRRFVRDDALLARRAISTLLKSWSGWRADLLPILPTVCAQSELAWVAKGMVVAEAAVDTLAAEELIARHWRDEDADFDAFDIACRATLWSPGIRDRLAAVFGRRSLASHAMAGYLTALAEAGRPDAAVDLLSAYLDAVSGERVHNFSFHDLEKVVAAAPIAFVRVVFPWFVRVAGPPAESRGIRDSFVSSSKLPFGWEDPHRGGTVLQCLRDAITLAAGQDPAAFLDIIGPHRDVEIGEVQALIADGFAANGSSLADEGLNWLLADRRRFDLGHVHASGDDGLIHTVTDWSTRRLLEAAVPHAAPNLLEQVRDALEAWDGYTDLAWEGDDAKTRLERRKWAESRRAPLLAILPAALITPRRRRRLTEVLAGEPKLKRIGINLMDSMVRSPMSPDQMALASDDDLMGMLNEAPDGAERFTRVRRRRGEGGYVEVGRAFGAFGTAHAQRAMALARNRFETGRHEYAAGELLRVLAESEAAADPDIRDLAHTLVLRGFDAPSFRSDVAWAFQRIAGRQNGLPDEDIALFERWLEVDQEILTDRILRSKLRTESNRERRAKTERAEKTEPNAILFGRFGPTLTLLPGGNYIFLSAIAMGRLTRDPPDAQRWLEVLEGHVHLTEEREVWQALLPRYGSVFHDQDRERVQKLLDRLWESTPDAFTPLLSGFAWSHRALLSPGLRQQVLATWRTSEDPRDRQLAGEYEMALQLVGEGEGPTDASPSAEERLGQAFTAATGWRTGDPAMRALSHAILSPIARSAEGDIASAVASAINRWEPPPADAATRELLEIALENPALLSACLGHGFGDVLQGLLREPGFEDLLLDVCDGALATMQGANRGPGAMFSKELVGICVALQRGPAVRRARAMDIYERLLDAGAYGAEEAASAALRR